jgi:hypothetical protein
MTKRFIFYVILLMTIVVIGESQTIYLPTSNEVYDFLKRMKGKGYLSHYQDAARPLSRNYIAQQLKNLEPILDTMTVLERSTYEFYVTEFHYELLSLSGDRDPREIRWHLLSKELTDGIINFDVGFIESAEIADNLKNTLNTKEVKLYGYAFNNIGFYFHLNDNIQWGSNLNYLRLNTPQKGVIPSSLPNITSYSWDIAAPLNTNNIQLLTYDEIDAQITWDIGAFTFSLEKMNNVWGFGQNGNNIFSNKAPSYAQVKMRVRLSDDIDFVYFHGELNSNVTDTLRSYSVNYLGLSAFRDVDHAKYIAAHQIEIRLWDGVDISLGESIVYSDRGPLLLYMIPVMFFKAGEHYNNDKDNCQLFGSLNLNIIRKTNIYLSVFIDEINTDKLFDDNDTKRQIALTLGAHTYDVLFENFELTAEYRRSNPAVYSHKYPSTTFTNNGYVLGDWIGQNADDSYLSVIYRPLHQLKLSVFQEIFRKGSPMSIDNQYTGNTGGFKFLDGQLHEEHMIGLRVHYQPFRDLFFDVKTQIHSLTDATDPALNYDSRFEFIISTSLGLW